MTWPSSFLQPGPASEKQEPMHLLDEEHFRFYHQGLKGESTLEPSAQGMKFYCFYFCPIPAQSD